MRTLHATTVGVAADADAVQRLLRAAGRPRHGAVQCVGNPHPAHCSPAVQRPSAEWWPRGEDEAREAAAVWAVHFPSPRLASLVCVSSSLTCPHPPRSLALSCPSRLKKQHRSLALSFPLPPQHPLCVPASSPRRAQQRLHSPRPHLLLVSVLSQPLSRPLALSPSPPLALLPSPSSPPLTVRRSLVSVLTVCASLWPPESLLASCAAESPVQTRLTLNAALSITSSPDTRRSHPSARRTGKSRTARRQSSPPAPHAAEN